jgi:deoxyribodipyrimidine photo-lyase
MSVLSLRVVWVQGRLPLLAESLEDSVLHDFMIIYWFKNDLRLADNTALHVAVADCDTVLPVYVIDKELLRSPHTGAAQTAFRLQSLEALRQNIEAAGGRLIVRTGELWEELRKLAQESGAKAIYWNREYDPASREREARIEKEARALGLETKSFKDDVIHEAGEVLKNDGTPYVVFTPYSKAWKLLPVDAALPVTKFKSPVPASIRSESIPTLAGLGFTLEAKIPEGGEKAGRDVLKKFTAVALLDYRRQRDFPALEGTSRLSPHLRLGTVSIRTVFAGVEKARQAHPKAGGIETFINELIWREFYRHVLSHFPHAINGSFRREYDALKWENNEKLFKAWCEGRTGFPIVDAAMRQLNTTGWMHNRLRMIVAMFLTKDLLVSWQWGERYFMEKLVDADPASNNGGWQWSASTGTDAAPYFRIFNPNSQAAKFDPEGDFIKRFVPEADTPSYPPPIVNHADQRIKTLALYGTLKSS